MNKELEDSNTRAVKELLEKIVSLEERVSKVEAFYQETCSYVGEMELIIKNKNEEIDLKLRENRELISRFSLQIDTKANETLGNVKKLLKDLDWKYN